MTLTRRTALKQLGLITGGLLLLPRCVRQVKPLSIPLKNISVTGDQEEMLGDIVEAIIPEGEIPGAKGLSVHQFVLRMVDDCQEPESQKIFVTGLAEIEARSRKKFDNAFASLSAPQRESLLLEMEKENIPATDKKKAQPATFLSLTKKYTIQGFLQSEYIMTNVLIYNMIPGRFDGCIPMERNKKIILG